MNKPKPLRGELWMIDLNPKKGREQKGVRPCLIVSTDAMNRSEFGTVILCPITTTETSELPMEGGTSTQRSTHGGRRLASQASLGLYGPDRDG